MRLVILTAFVALRYQHRILGCNIIIWVVIILMYFHLFGAAIRIIICIEGITQS